MKTTFTQLNRGWNADPNNPEPKVNWQEDDLVLRFYMNSFLFLEYQEGDIGEIVFRDCSRYRLGTLNDDAWYQGQSRWAGVEHAWGEFYQVIGDLQLESVPDDWDIHNPDVEDRTHFIFYFRDGDFECDAKEWELKIIRAKEE